MGEDELKIELIDKDKAINALIPIMCEHSIEEDVQSEIILCLLNVPTVEAKPVAHGEWIESKGVNYWFAHTCSICGEFEDFEYNFCPNCGADMRCGKNG